jgi:hypothetical protein
VKGIINGVCKINPNPFINTSAAVGGIILFSAAVGVLPLSAVVGG